MVQFWLGDKCYNVFQIAFFRPDKSGSNYRKRIKARRCGIWERKEKNEVKTKL